MAKGNDREAVSFWRPLEDLLRPSYESLESLRQDVKEAKADSSASSSSASAHSDGQAGDTGEVDDGYAEDDTVASANSAGTCNKADETENMDVKRKLAESKTRLDLDSIDGFERMYAADLAFMASGLEARFERLVPQRFTLI